MSSPHFSRNGGSSSPYDSAQLELRYTKESPKFVQRLLAKGLTSCEREVCYLALESRDIKEAVSRRGGSTKTVEKHRAQVIKKLGVPPKVELKNYLLELLMTLRD